MKESRNKVIFHNVAPAILANACVFLFSVVDGIFVGQGAGMLALGAVNLALPFVLIVQALNSLTCIGGVTITAVRFGGGNRKGAQSAFFHSITLSLLVGCAVTAVGCGLTGPICRLLGASGGCFQLACDYVFWWALFAVANSLSLNLQSFCRNDGDPGLVAVTNVVVTVLNIFLDWLFVFPMGKGVAGAAIATGISQTVGLLVILTHFLRKKGELRLRPCALQRNLYGKIILRGLPEAIAQFSTPVTTFCMNRVLMSAYGEIGISAFSVISYLSSFTMSVFFGASEGMQPLFGQAYGAEREDDLRSYFRAGVWISAVGSALCVAVYILFPQVLCGLFGADAQTTDFTARHMWEYCWGFVVGSVNTIISAYFYSTRRSGQAILLNVVRSLAMNSLVITLLPALLGRGVVWHTFGIYEVLVLAFALVQKKLSERRGITFASD